MTPYRDVLTSQRWKDLKWRRIMVARFCCEGCGAPYIGRRRRGAMRVFQLHHRHYLTVGREGLDDVMVLCRPCHMDTHGIQTGEPAVVPASIVLGQYLKALTAIEEDG